MSNQPDMWSRYGHELARRHLLKETVKIESAVGVLPLLADIAIKSQ